LARHEAQNRAENQLHGPSLLESFDSKNDLVADTARSNPLEKRLRIRERFDSIVGNDPIGNPNACRVGGTTGDQRNNFDSAAALARAKAEATAGGHPVRLRVGGINEDGPESRGAAERCLLGFSTGPPMLPAGYNNNVQLFQSPGWVVLLNEMVHDVRVIPVDGRDALPPNLDQWLGSSRAHWDGETLVIETTNFTDRTGSFNTSFVSWGSAEHLTLIERFTRTDADTVLYEFTVNDPDTWTETFSGQFPMLRSGDPLYEYACHEGNYGMQNMLSGARATERAETNQP